MKKAFTLLELVFVIVVIGILAATVLSRSDNTRVQEAAIQVVSHIRYAQHLAMIDDHFDTVHVNNANNANWFRARWQIFFQVDNLGNQNQVYLIYSDKDFDGNLAANGEIAIDPLSGRQMTGNTGWNNSISSMNLTRTYGIIARAFTGGCANSAKIVFDHLGRPHINDNTAYGSLMNTQCQMTFMGNDGNVTIAIEPETGYVHIL